MTREVSSFCTQTTDPTAIWVSHDTHCLAFHQEPHFKSMFFDSEKELWQTVEQFIQSGYRIR